MDKSCRIETSTIMKMGVAESHLKVEIKDIMFGNFGNNDGQKVQPAIVLRKVDNIMAAITLVTMMAIKNTRAWIVLLLEDALKPYENTVE